MYHRILKSELIAVARKYPVVTIIGPRQSGKTTLVRHVFPDKPYVNLEAPDIRELAQLDPRSFLAQYPKGAIFDEIQRSPQLLSYIQVIVDEVQRKGMFILTGSHQLELHQGITQSLAGRTALLTLLPLSLVELAEAGFEQSLDDLLLNGGYPGFYKDQLEPAKAYRSYFQTYIERDLRQLIHVKDLTQFQRFVRVCVGRVGQLLNSESSGNDIASSSQVQIKHWISILEASFIVIAVESSHENFGKRIFKTSKTLFYRSGLGK